MNEPKVLQVGTETPTEKIAGEHGTSSATVSSTPKELTKSEEVVAGVNQTNVKAVATGNTNERSLQVSQEQRAGHYERNVNSGIGFERSKGEKAVVNTITVEEVKSMLKVLENYINNIVETIRKGQYVEVDTTEYPTLDSFLASTGEQGTVYLYPVGNSANNYYQYIWEVDSWISLGTTTIDLSEYIKGTYLTQAEYDDLDTKDPNMYYFTPEE